MINFHDLVFRIRPRDVFFILLLGQIVALALGVL